VPRRATFWFLLIGCNLAGVAQPNPSPQAQEGFQISGVVEDADTGQPLAHSRVAMAPLSRREDLTVITTGEDGHFSFSPLAAGKYALSAQARGHLQQQFNQHDLYSSAVAVGPGLSANDLVFKLPAESSISGEVIDEAGEGVRDANVTLYSTGLAAGTNGLRVHARSVTNDDGSYHFPHLQQGRYLVSVNVRPWYAAALSSNQPEKSDRADPGPGEIRAESSDSPLNVAYPITFYGGATEERSATEIVIARGEKFIANIALQPVPALRLRFVMGSDARPEVFATLEQRVGDGSFESVAVLNQSPRPGVGVINGVAPGHYLVRAFNRAGGRASAVWREIDVDSNSGVETLGGSAVPLSVTVEADASALPRQTTVHLLNKKTRETVSQQVTLEGEAVFEQGIAPGSYEVSLTSDAGFYVKNVTAAGARVLGRTVEISVGQPVKLTIATAHGEGEINGTAVRDGKGFSGGLVLLVPADPAHNQVLFRRDQSDSDGTFTLKNVVPGKYTVLAIENGWELEWTKPSVLRSYLGKGTSVIVQPNGKYEVKATVQ
jgi:hypothetical protein